MGKKTWIPGKSLQKFIAATFDIQPKEQQHLVQAMAQHPGFADIGKRMLMAWAEGVPNTPSALHKPRPCC